VNGPEIGPDDFSRRVHRAEHLAFPNTGEALGSPAGHASQGRAVAISRGKIWPVER